MSHSSKHRGPWSPIAVVFLAVLATAALSAVVMYLWNTILSPVVGVATITIWQALGLFILSRILFGRFGGGWGGRGKHHKRKKAWREKWQSMSDEEKAAVKARWREKRWWHEKEDEENSNDN